MDKFIIKSFSYYTNKLKFSYDHEFTIKYCDTYVIIYDRYEFYEKYDMNNNIWDTFIIDVIVTYQYWRYSCVNNEECGSNFEGLTTLLIRHEVSALRYIINSMIRHNVILLYYNRKRYTPKFYDFKSIISIRPEIIIRFNDDMTQQNAHKLYFYSYKRHLSPLDSIVFESMHKFINHVCLLKDRICGIKENYTSKQIELILEDKSKQRLYETIKELGLDNLPDNKAILIFNEVRQIEKEAYETHGTRFDKKHPDPLYRCRNNKYGI